MGIHNAENINGNEYDVIEQDGSVFKVPRFSHYNYRCLLSQSGTDNPVAKVLEDSFVEPIEWVRHSSTQYRVVITDMFPAGLTFTGKNCARIDDDTIEVTSGGDDTMSNYPVEFSVYLLEVTPVVSNFAATGEMFTIGLTWDDNADEYQIQRLKNDQTSWMEVYQGGDDSYTDFDLNHTTEYVYRIRQKQDGKAWSKWLYLTAQTDIS